MKISDSLHAQISMSVVGKHWQYTVTVAFLVMFVTEVIWVNARLVNIQTVAKRLLKKIFETYFED